MSRNPAREEALFSDALAQPEALRGHFLDEACNGDAALRARLAALLSAHDESEGLQPPHAGIPIIIPTEEKPGDRLGRYKLVRKIGEGGCGAVYLAEQEEPVRRQVAVKVIKSGMDTREVINRFSAEQQALALMDHPGIAKVYDAGAAHTGRAYFVMELVQGAPITRFCDEQRLSLPARLELFILVCHAVQHAHQKGVIHRDLKSSNILVTLHDGVATPKVIDFGIAKATHGQLTATPLVTAVDQMIGTPAFMSPEQVDTNALDIDTRSDVYSLGVLLYELLSGLLPFDPRALSRASRDDFRHMIREVEPPRPSARVGALTAEARVPIAAARGVDAGRLPKLLDGDLDRIVMKAIEKDRSHRYDTPTALAADITRHLRHEPVLARPHSRWYRSAKFIRRHRVGFTASAAIALVLIAGVIFSTWQAVRARRAEHVAVTERSRAEGLVTFMIDDLRGRLQRVGQLDLLDALGTKALEYFAARDPRELSDAALATHAKALTQIGGLRLDQGRYPEAKEAYTEAYARTAELVTRHPRDGEMLLARGQAEFGNGSVYYRSRDVAAARTWFVRYRDTAAALVALDASNLSWRQELAMGQQNLSTLDQREGRLEAAREGFVSELPTLQHLLEARPDDVELKAQIAEVTSFLGSLAETTGDIPDAIRRFHDQVRQLEKIQEGDPANSRWRYKLAEALMFLSGVLTVSDQVPAAERHLLRARQILDGLVTQDGTNQRWRLALFIAQLRQASLSKRTGSPEAALHLVETTRKILDQMAASQPADRGVMTRQAGACRLEAELLHELGRPGAFPAAARALELDEKLIGRGSPSASDLGEFAQACLIAGHIVATDGDAELRSRYWEAARERLARAARESKDWRILDPLARIAALTGQTQEAQERFAQLKSFGYVPLEPWPLAEAGIIVQSAPKNAPRSIPP